MSAASASERPRRSDAQQSREALLAAARELFAERGPEALTVVGVAKRAGLNRSTAYQHFRKREDLVRAVGAAFASEVHELLGQPRALGEQVDFFVHYFRERPDIARLWLFRLLAGEGSIPARGWRDYVTRIERLARSPRAQRGIDAEMLGMIAMTSALVWSLMVRERTKSEEEARAETRRFARELERLFLYGALRPEAWPELVAELERGGVR